MRRTGERDRGTAFFGGVYMPQSPLRVHVPWMWSSFGDSPFDGTDADRYDFGYALPLDDRGERIVLTLHRESCREGYDDIVTSRRWRRRLSARVGGVLMSRTHSRLSSKRRRCSRICRVTSGALRVRALF
ncbi:MAG: hypothetical protein ACOCX2_06875 [Armatimonadota bacterium]